MFCQSVDIQFGLFIESGVYKEVIYGKVLLISDCGVGNYAPSVNHKHCISAETVTVTATD